MENTDLIAAINRKRATLNLATYTTIARVFFKINKRASALSDDESGHRLYREFCRFTDVYLLSRLVDNLSYESAVAEASSSSSIPYSNIVEFAIANLAESSIFRQRFEIVRPLFATILSMAADLDDLFSEVRGSIVEDPESEELGEEGDYALLDNPIDYAEVIWPEEPRDSEDSEHSDTDDYEDEDEDEVGEDEGDDWGEEVVASDDDDDVEYEGDEDPESGAEFRARMLSILNDFNASQQATDPSANNTNVASVPRGVTTLGNIEETTGAVSNLWATQFHVDSRYPQDLQRGVQAREDVFVTQRALPEEVVTERVALRTGAFDFTTLLEPPAIVASTSMVFTNVRDRQLPEGRPAAGQTPLYLVVHRNTDGGHTSFTPVMVTDCLDNAVYASEQHGLVINFVGDRNRQSLLLGDTENVFYRDLRMVLY